MHEYGRRPLWSIKWLLSVFDLLKLEPQNWHLNLFWSLWMTWRTGNLIASSKFHLNNEIQLNTLTICIFNVRFVFKEIPQMLQMYWVELWISSWVFNLAWFLNLFSLWMGVSTFRIMKKRKKRKLGEGKSLTRSGTGMARRSSGWFGAPSVHPLLQNLCHNHSIETVAASDAEIVCAIEHWKVWWIFYHNRDKSTWICSLEVDAHARV